jgi:hypothetical protein|tara:strand:+ start:749 stop:1165 length:417 start_codon:yes stop_codon:yes gene_type:complete
MKWTTVIAAVAALFVGTQTADAGLLDFLRLNRSNKCEVKTAKPKCAKPAAPKCAKPAAPKCAKPAAPKCAKPAAPKCAKPAAPKCAKPAAPKCAKPAAPKCAKPAAPKTAKGCEYEKKTTLLPRIRLPQIRRISLFNN